MTPENVVKAIFSLGFIAGGLVCMGGYARLWWQLYTSQGANWRAAKLPGAVWALGGLACGAAIWAIWNPAVLDGLPVVGVALLFLAWLAAESLTSSYALAEKWARGRRPKTQPPAASETGDLDKSKEL